MPVTPEQRKQWAELRKQEESFIKQAMKAKKEGDQEKVDEFHGKAKEAVKQAVAIVNPK